MPKRTQRGLFAFDPRVLSAGSEPPSSGRMTFALRQVFWLMAFPSDAFAVALAPSQPFTAAGLLRILTGFLAA